ncbi:hypothetical protein M3Y98_00381900 [Aphelenchoides besseyi]|nr:hypothetical protein M3Y98_00381900 [Aphelenchoides besseyi]
MTNSQAQPQDRRSKRRLETGSFDSRRKIQNVEMSESGTTTDYPSMSTEAEHNSTSNGAIITSGASSKQPSNGSLEHQNLLNQTADIQREIFSYLNIFDLFNLRKIQFQFNLFPKSTDKQ